MGDVGDAELSNSSCGCSILLHREQASWARKRKRSTGAIKLLRFLVSVLALSQLQQTSKVGAQPAAWESSVVDISLDSSLESLATAVDDAGDFYAAWRNGDDLFLFSSDAAISIGSFDKVSNTWQTLSTLPTQFVSTSPILKGPDVDLQVDSDGLFHIAYSCQVPLRTTNSTCYSVYNHNAAVNPWTPSRFATDGWGHPKLALGPVSGGEVPHIAVVLEAGAGDQSLRHATLQTGGTGTAFVAETVASGRDIVVNGIVVDADDTVYILYTLNGTTLTLAQKAVGAVVWARTSIVSGIIIDHADMAYDGVSLHGSYTSQGQVFYTNLNSGGGGLVGFPVATYLDSPADAATNEFGRVALSCTNVVIGPIVAIAFRSNGELNFARALTNPADVSGWSTAKVSEEATLGGLDISVGRRQAGNEMLILSFANSTIVSQFSSPVKSPLDAPTSPPTTTTTTIGSTETSSPTAFTTAETSSPTAFTTAETSSPTAFTTGTGATATPTGAQSSSLQTQAPSDFASSGADTPTLSPAAPGASKRPTAIPTRRHRTWKPTRSPSASSRPTTFTGQPTSLRAVTSSPTLVAFTTTEPTTTVSPTLAPTLSPMPTTSSLPTASTSTTITFFPTIASTDEQAASVRPTTVVNPTAPACKRLGQKCKNTADCCPSKQTIKCIKQTCKVDKKKKPNKCAKEGKSCQASNDCCGNNLECIDRQCVDPKCSRKGSKCQDKDDCGVGCDTMKCSKGTCEKSKKKKKNGKKKKKGKNKNKGNNQKDDCRKKFDKCHLNVDCCNEMICKRKNTPDRMCDTCSLKDQACEGGGDCCRGLSCRDGSCKDCMDENQRGCTLTRDCCGPLICESSVCQFPKKHNNNVDDAKPLPPVDDSKSSSHNDNVKLPLESDFAGQGEEDMSPSAARVSLAPEMQ